MRCGKGLPTGSLKPSAIVATRANALWQSLNASVSSEMRLCRNPRECAVAKFSIIFLPLLLLRRNPRECAVAKFEYPPQIVNRRTSQPARMRCGKEQTGNEGWLCIGRNPRECAVAKIAEHLKHDIVYCRNPRECAVAKMPKRRNSLPMAKSQPARMRCGKDWFKQVVNVQQVASQPARMRCGKVHALNEFLRPKCRNPRECAVAKVSEQTAPSGWRGRNPRECAVAKYLSAQRAWME